MPKNLKVGLIGVGGIACTHYPGWNDSKHAELIALADINPKALKQHGEEQNIDRLYEKAEDLIRDKDIDIIDICTPNSYHAPLTIAALNAGKHVLCEKPLATDPKEIQKMIAARDKSGKLLMTAQHQRFAGPHIALKQEMNRLGEIYHSRCWYLRRNSVPLSPGFLYHKHSGGGPCIDIGVHILDLALWMMNHPKPVSVTGITQNRLIKQPGSFSQWGGKIPRGVDVEEFATAMVRFDTGASLILEVSWMLHHNHPDEDFQLWLYGDKGGAHLPSNELYLSDNKKQQKYDIKLKNTDGEKPHALECQAFAQAIAQGKPSPVPAEQSLQVQQILNALYKSAKTGREVRL